MNKIIITLMNGETKFYTISNINQIVFGLVHVYIHYGYAAEDCIQYEYKELRSIVIA